MVVLLFFYFTAYEGHLTMALWLVHSGHASNILVREGVRIYSVCVWVKCVCVIKGVIVSGQLMKSCGLHL